MTQGEWTALLALTTAASLTPGPNTLLSTALAANLGLRRALRFVLAVPVGWGVLFSLCSAGLGAMVVAWPLLRHGVQALGIGYLLWLAYRLAHTQALAAADTQRLAISFWQGVALQFLNIKAWMLALTVVAGWLAGQQDAATRFAQVLPVMLLYGLVSNLMYALMGSMLREWLSGPDGSARRLRVFNRLMAGVLVLTAVWMARL